MISTLGVLAFAQEEGKVQPPFRPALLVPESPFRAATFGSLKPIQFPKVKFSYGQAIIESYFTMRNIPATASFSAQTTVKLSKFAIGASYQRTGKNASGESDVENLGAWWNPSDIQAVTGRFQWSVAPNLDFEAGQSIYAPLTSALDTGANAQSTLFGVSYKPSDNFRMSLQYEDLKRSGASLAYAYAYAANERWYTLGLGYRLNERTNFRFFWQLSDVDLKSGSLNLFNNTNAQRPGLVSTQLSIKF